jgi:hypothetical protein
VKPNVVPDIFVQQGIILFYIDLRKNRCDEMAEGDEQKKFEITLYISIACGLASFTIFCLIYRRSLFYWYLRPPPSPQTT